MPELPDITIYIEALEQRIIGKRLEGVRLSSPFVLRTFEPALEEVEGKTVQRAPAAGQADRHRPGRGALARDAPDDRRPAALETQGAKAAGKNNLAAFDFSTGTLMLTEAGSKRRAALHLCEETALAEHEPGRPRGSLGDA